MSGTARAAADDRPGGSAAALVAVLFGIGMLIAFIGSLGAPLIPRLADLHGRSVAATQWALTITLLTGAVTTPVLGRLGDGPHRRTAMLGALTAISCGALVCALPGGFTLLLVGRCLQGMGMGLMPVAMTVARDHLPADRAARTIALLSVTTAFGAGVGFPLSGFTSDVFGVRATFTLAGILSMLAFVAAYKVVPSSRHQAARPLDLAGAVLLAIPLALLVTGLSQASQWGLGSGRFWACLLGAVIGFATWTRHQLRTPHPLVDLRSMRVPPVIAAHLAALLSGAGMFLLFSLMMSFVQMPESTGYGMGRSVFFAGMLLVPLSITTYVAARMLPTIGAWVGERWVMPFGCAVYLSSVALFLVARHSIVGLAAISAGSGFGLGILLASLPRKIVGSIARSENGSALGFNQVLRTVGGTVGSSLGGAVFAANTPAGARYPLESGYVHVGIAALVTWIVLLAVTWPRPGVPRMTAGQPDPVGTGVDTWPKRNDPDDGATPPAREPTCSTRPVTSSASTATPPPPSGPSATGPAPTRR